MKKTFFDSEKVRAIFTDRTAGNLGLHVGDVVERVEENRKKVLQELGVKDLAWMEQIHSNVVKVVSENGEIKECDGIITNEKNLALMVMVADCTPILLFDEKKGVVGVVHSGRKGTFSKIVQKAILKMQTEFGSAVKNIQVSCGPSIQKCCYEFEWKFLDLPEMVKKQLLEIGVLEKNIEISDVCTKCNQNYFSYRRNKKTGRFAGIIFLK